MRVLVYAAGVYALGVGCAEAAFAPAPAGSEKMCTGRGCGLPPKHERSSVMGGQSALHMTAKGSIEDPSDIVARANSMLNGQSIYSAAASFESSYVGKSAQKPAEKPQASEGWTPPVGYVPSGRRPASQARPTATDPVTARVNEMLTSGAGAAVAAPQPPTKKWEPYGGYEPKGRQGGASGKKWQPYGGYDPKNRRSGAPQQAPSSYSAPAQAPVVDPEVSTMYAPAQNEAPSTAYVPTSVAQQSRSGWKAPVGYVPDRLKAQGETAGYVPDRFKIKGEIDMLSSAPAKKWTPPLGYDPKNRGRAASADSSLAPTRAVSKDDLVADNRLAKTTAAILKERLPAVLKEAQASQMDKAGLLTARTLGRASDKIKAVPAKIVTKTLQGTETLTKASQTLGRAVSLTSAAIEGLSRAVPSVPLSPGKSAKPAGEYLNTLTKAPNKKWTAPTGYVPKKGFRAPSVMQAPTQLISSVDKMAKGTFEAVIASSQTLVQTVSKSVEKLSPSQKKPAARLDLKGLAATTSKLLAERAPNVLYESGFTNQLHEQCDMKQREEEEANKKRWKPYGGYVPDRIKNRQFQYEQQAKTAYSNEPIPQDKIDALSNAPAKKWEPYGYGGYVPDRHKSGFATAAPVRASSAPPAPAPAYRDSYAAPAPVQMTSAPAKKWEPYGYGGYTPKRDAAPAAAAPAPTYSAPAYAAPAPVQMTSAPAKKWEPYGGYTPKRDAAPAPSAPAPMYSSAAPAAAPAPVQMTSAPAKKWEPYGGYTPKRDAATAAAAPAPSPLEKNWEPYGSQTGGDAGGSDAKLPLGYYLYPPSHTRASDVAAWEASVDVKTVAPLHTNGHRAPANGHSAATASEAERLSNMYSATYSPEIEAQRAERMKFYAKLGVPEEEARQLVAKIVDSYAKHK